MCFLDTNPLTKGHSLVVPKEEINHIFDLDSKTWKELWEFAKNTGEAIKRTIECSKVAIVVAGLEVYHAHIHLIPIKSMSDLDFSKKRLKLDEEEFQEIASSIRMNIIN